MNAENADKRFFELRKNLFQRSSASLILRTFGRTLCLLEGVAISTVGMAITLVFWQHGRLPRENWEERPHLVVAISLGSLALLEIAT